MDGAVGSLEAAIAGGSANGSGSVARARRALADVGADDTARGHALDVLARHAAAGSPLAAELLLEALDKFGVARRAVRQFLFDDHAVDDVVQDTLISVARSIGSFRGESRFTTWLHRVARSRAVDHLRRVRSTEPLGELDRSATERMSSLIASRQSVRQLLERLPDRYRQPVLLRDVEGLSYAQVASRLDANLNTVKSLVARGRALVAGMVDQEAPAAPAGPTEQRPQVERRQPAVRVELGVEP